MRSLEIVHTLSAAEPIPRASRKLFGRFYAALMFGSRNSVSLCGASCLTWAVCQREAMRRCKIVSFSTCSPETRNSIGPRHVFYATPSYRL